MPTGSNLWQVCLKYSVHSFHSPCHWWVQLGFYNFRIVSHALHYRTSSSSLALLLLSEANKIDKSAQHSAAVFFVLLHLVEEKLPV